MLGTLTAQAALEHPEPAKQGKIYHVGGDVKAPRVISSPQPQDATNGKVGEKNTQKKAVDAGTTVLSIVVAEDGSVRSVKVLRSLKHDLDAKAVDAVKQWKCEPAMKKGVPVAVELDLQVDFHFYK
jgi:TonB family protein